MLSFTPMLYEFIHLTKSFTKKITSTSCSFSFLTPKVFTKGVHQRCSPKVFAKGVHQRCSPKVFTKGVAFGKKEKDKKQQKAKKIKIIFYFWSKRRNYLRQKSLDIEMQKETDFLPNLSYDFF